MTTASSSFSVLIPAYRAGKTIGATLQSVAKQMLCPGEILIYEDGCYDDLAKTVAEFAESSPCPVRLLSCPLNGGVSRARNILLREAAGEFIAFLDADDIWAPDHLFRAAEAFAAGADVAFSGVTFIDGSGQEIPGQAEPSAEQLADIAPSMFRYNFVQCTSTLSLRREWIDRVGNFDVTLSHGEDLDLWLRLLAADAVWRYTGRCSCTYRKHATSAMGQTLLVVERMAAFYEKHLSNPLIPPRNAPWRSDPQPLHARPASLEKTALRSRCRPSQARPFTAVEPRLSLRAAWRAGVVAFFHANNNRGKIRARTLIPKNLPPRSPP